MKGATAVWIVPAELGARIRSLRKERSLSLEEVSAKSGVALATLSRIENGKGSGTFRTHQRIADAFGLPLTELYRNLREQDREAHLLEAKSEEAETFTYDEKTSAILLAKQVSRKQMLPQMLILESGGKTTMEQYPPGTDRWIFGLEGSAEVTVGESAYRVSEGSTLYFRASLPHSFQNPGKQTAKLVSVTSPVTF